MHCLILYDILLTPNPVCKEPEELTLIGSEKEKGTTDARDWSLHHPAASAPSQLLTAASGQVSETNEAPCWCRDAAKESPVTLRMP